jgi:hypothetical protein
MTPERTAAHAGQGLARVQRLVGHLGHAGQGGGDHGVGLAFPGRFPFGLCRCIGLGGLHGSGSGGASRGDDLALAQRQHAALEVGDAAAAQVLVDHPQVHVVHALELRSSASSSSGVSGSM